MTTIVSSTIPAHSTGIPSARRISWGAILGGVIIALVVQLLLTMLGTGIGLGTIDPAQGESPSAGSFGIGAGIWWALSSLVALFAGGWAAGRLASVPSTQDSVLHGVLTWGVATLISAYLVASVLGGVVNGAMGAVRGIAGGATQAATAMAPGIADQVKQMGGFDLGSLRNEAMKTLQQTGKPDLQPAAISERAQAAAGSAESTAKEGAKRPEATDEAFGSLFDRLFKEGKGIASQADADALANVVAARTGMSKEESQAVVQRWGDQAQKARAAFDDQVGKAKEQARVAADATAAGVSRAALWGFLALVLGAVAAGFGGLRGQPRTALSA